MSAKLIVLSGITEGESFEIPLGQRVTLGTSVGCDARLIANTDGVKLAAIEGTDEGWSLSIEQGFPWIVDSSLVDEKKKMPLKENSLIRLSPDGPDLRFRISNVGDATKDVQTKSTKIGGFRLAEEEETSEPYVLQPLPEKKKHDPSKSLSESREWEPDPQPVEAFAYLRFIIPAALVLIPLIAIVVYLMFF